MIRGIYDEVRTSASKMCVGKLESTLNQHFYTSIQIVFYKRGAGRGAPVYDVYGQCSFGRV